MRLGRPKVALVMTDDERVQLTSMAHRSRTTPHLARRARIVLACAEGQPSTVVAKRVRVSPVTVCEWRTRFLRDRVDGLHDEPRPGTPRRISDEQIEQGDRADARRDPARSDPLEQPGHGEGERRGPDDRPADSAATELLEELNKLTTDEVRRSREWPRNGRSLSDDLRHLAPALRKGGLEVTFRRTSHARLVILEMK